MRTAGFAAFLAIVALLAAPPSRAQTAEKAAAEKTAAAVPVVDGPSVAWKVALWGKKRPFTAAAEVMKRHVEARTGGKWTMQLGYEQFGGAKEFPDLLKVGAVQAAQFAIGYSPDRMPLYTVFELPFLPLTDLHAYAAAADAVNKHPAAIAEMARWNAKVVATTLSEPYEFMGRGKPALLLADFKGLRVRALGGMGAAMLRLGAVPTSVEAPEVYTALERGTIDATALPATSHQAYRTYEVGKWFTRNLGLGFGSSPVVVALSEWEKLPPQYQAILDELPAASLAEFEKTYEEAAERYVPLMQKRGIQFITYPETELAEFRHVAGEPVWDAWAKDKEAKNLPGREILNLLLNTVKAQTAKR